jgi:hypothetical protein
MTALTPKVYWTTAPRSMMQQFGEIMREFSANEQEPDPAETVETAEIGLPDEEITTWVDTTAFGGQKFDALAAHATPPPRPPNLSPTTSRRHNSPPDTPQCAAIPRGSRSEGPRSFRTGTQ